jgi:hypothetical protein
MKRTRVFHCEVDCGDFPTTVVGVSKITGKSVTSLHRALSLLKLSDEIQLD